MFCLHGLVHQRVQVNRWREKATCSCRCETLFIHKQTRFGLSVSVKRLLSCQVMIDDIICRAPLSLRAHHFEDPQATVVRKRMDSGVLISS